MELLARGSSFPDLGPTIVGVSLSLVLLATLCVAVRVIYRARNGSFGWDDALIIIAIVISLGHSAVDVMAVYIWGYGRHTVNLTPAQAAAPGTTLGFWLQQILYKTTIPFTKASILLLYRRIFSRAGRPFNIALWTILGLTAAYYTAAFFVTVFQCTPVQKAWLKSLPGHCVNAFGFYYANAAFNIATDVAIIILPIPVIKSLHLPVRQRTMLCLVFAVGLLATAISINRIFTLAGGAADKDFTWESAPGDIWSSAEMNVSIVCACLPTLKAPMQAVFPRLFGASGRSTGYASRQGHRHPLNSAQARKRASLYPAAVQMDTMDRRLTGATAYRINSRDGDSDETYFLDDSDSEGKMRKEGIIKKMDFKVEYEKSDEAKLGESPVLGKAL